MRYCPTPTLARRSGLLRYSVLTLLFASTLAPQTNPVAGIAPGSSDADIILAWRRDFHCGQQYYTERRLLPAEKCFASALLAAEMLSGGDDLRGATLGSLGAIARELGRIPEAERLAVRSVEAFRKSAVERREVGLARSLHNLALVYFQQNRLVDAELLLRESLGLCTRAAACGSDAALVLVDLAWLASLRNRPAAAVSHLRSALSVLHDIDGAHQNRADVYATLSVVLLGMKSNHEAAQAAQQALSSELSGSAVRPSAIVRYSCALAAASSAIGDYAMAERSLLRAQDTLSNPVDAPAELGLLLATFGDLRASQKRFAEAAQFQSRAIEVLNGHLSADHQQMLVLKASYAIVLRKLARKREARRVEQEMASAERSRTADPGSGHMIGVSDLEWQRKTRNRKP